MRATSRRTRGCGSERTVARGAERRARQRRWLTRLLDETILNEFRSRPGFQEALASAQASFREGRATVPQAVGDSWSGSKSLIRGWCELAGG
jgi:hypothetical protein